MTYEADLARRDRCNELYHETVEKLEDAYILLASSREHPAMMEHVREIIGRLERERDELRRALT